MSRPTDWSLAVDFGTSNTAAAHTNPVSGRVETLALRHEGATMSSSVYVESPDRIDVGDVAVDRAETNPVGFLVAPKRAIPLGDVSVNGYDLRASAPVAAVLGAVLRRATAAHNGQAPARLVLTHPEAWSPREVGVLVEAAERLGLSATAIDTLSEPRAAAHYYSGVNTVAAGDRIAVFDFGGGTLDVAVLRSTPHGGFEVVAARGDNGLGGKNFDAALRRWLDRQIENRDPDLLTYVRTLAPMEARFGLDESIRRAKELLSEAPSATLSVPGPSGPERFQITRDEFEEIIAPALDRAVDLVAATLADAGEVGELYLTGGSSRIPVVHERLRELAPIATLDDPKTVVAQGALTAVGISGAAGAAPATRPLPTPPVAAADTRSGRAVRPAVVGAVVLLALVLGVGGYALMSSGAGSGPEETSAAGVSSGDAAVGSGDAADGASDADPARTPELATTEEAARAGLPPSVNNAITDCKINGETDAGALELRCAVDATSPDMAGIAVKRDSLSVFFSVDKAEAAKSVVGLRKKLGISSLESNELVENPARTAAANISGDDRLGYSFDYASSETNLKLAVFGGNFETVDAAKSFLTTHGLLD